MKLITNIESEQLKNTISHKLIPNGIGMINMRKFEEMNDFVSDQDEKVYLISNKDVKSALIFAKKIKEGDNSNKSKVVFLKKVNDASEVRTLLKLGFDGILPLQWKPELIANKLCEIMMYLYFPKNRRTHIRVKTDKDDIAMIKWNSIVGNITDICMEGVAVHFSHEDLSNISNNDLLENVQLHLNGEITIVNAKIIRKEKNFIVLSYDELTDDNKDILSEFICSKVQKIIIHS